MDYLPFTVISLIPFIVSVFYSIIKYGLLNIKIIATEIFVFTLLLVSIFEVMMTTNVKEIIFRTFIFLTTMLISIFLIKSVHNEVVQREQLEILAKELEEKNQKLLQLNQFKSQFLSFASHQIKTPVAVIKGFAGLIYDGSYGNVPEKVRDVVGRIKQATDEMIVLLNNFLDLRKIDEGRMEYNFCKINVVALVKEIVADLQIMADNKKLSLSGEYEKDEININADKEKLRQVIQNLIENAIKYTESGFVKVKVKVDGKFVIISVIDSGIGMSKKILTNIFDQFTRNSEIAKTIAGTGLGLYIAKQITLAHKGEIWAESDGEGKGSRFYVRLPM